MRKPTETNLVHAVLAWLHLHGIYAWRNNSGALRAGKRFVRFGLPGSSDILGLLPPSGRLLAIECKTGRNMPTRAQVTFLEQVANHGGLAVLVYSLADLEAALAPYFQATPRT